MLKLFRVNHLVSSARLDSHVWSFCRNADRFRTLGEPTVAIKQLFHFSDSNHSTVLYQPLPGRIVRQIALLDGLNRRMLEQLGVFVATLRRHGIYFRSLYFGNIVQTPEGELGLLDIADFSIRSWSLFCFERLRNFRHIFRLEEDRATRQRRMAHLHRGLYACHQAGRALSTENRICNGAIFRPD